VSAAFGVALGELRDRYFIENAVGHPLMVKRRQQTRSDAK
jgi:hypothetical protein